MKRQMLYEEIKKVLNDYEEEIKARKENINANYILAKLDILAIDNYCDTIETLKKILEELDNLQNRIIERNRGA